MPGKSGNRKFEIHLYGNGVNQDLPTFVATFLEFAVVLLRFFYDESRARIDWTEDGEVRFHCSPAAYNSAPSNRWTSFAFSKQYCHLPVRVGVVAAERERCALCVFRKPHLEGIHGD